MSKNIIFDWSGVVKDAFGCHLWVVNKMFKKFGVKELTMAELKENWEQPHMSFYNKYLPGLTDTEQDSLYKEAILNSNCPKSKDYPGVCEFIKKLKKEGFFLGVISTDLSETLLPEIKKYGLENVFDEVITDSSDKVAALKNMMEKFELKPAETFFIGDSNHEILASRENGTKSIAVTWGFNTEEYLKSKNPDYLVHNIKELEEVLLK